MQRSLGLGAFFLLSRSAHFRGVRFASLNGLVLAAAVGCGSNPGSLFDDDTDRSFNSEGTVGSSKPAAEQQGASTDSEEESATTAVPSDVAATGPSKDSELGRIDEEGISAEQPLPVSSMDTEEQIADSDTLPPVDDVDEVLRPTVVSVEPPNGALGVSAETAIVIGFSVSMNRSVTQAAYQSEALPSDSVDFAWNDASTQLTITPRTPLEYNSGSDPEQVEARRIGFFLSASAEDTEGNSLGSPAESGFSLLREIRGQLSAVVDRSLSGSYRSDDSYGGGQCTREDATICFGDSGQGNDISYRGFVTFDLASVPSDLAELSSAQLTFDIADLEGQPFTLGDLQVEHAEFEEIGLDAFNGQALASIGVISRTGEPGDTFSINVIDALGVDLSSRSRAQFRLSFEVFNDEEDDFDAVVTSVDSHTLDYAFLLP